MPTEKEQWEARDREWRERIAAIGNKPACYTCSFYSAARTGPDGSRHLFMNDRAECRRHSPTSNGFTWQGTGMAVGRWPGTQPWDWCGDYVKVSQ
jgi:hypothetical protein